MLTIKIGIRVKNIRREHRASGHKKLPQVEWARTSSLLDLYNLSTEQRAHLLRFLPVELERPMSSPVGLELAVLTRIHRDLGQFLAALRATVTRWLWTNNHLHQAVPTYGGDATVLFADVTWFTALPQVM